MLLQPRPLILTGLPYKRDDRQREVTRTARTGSDSSLTVTYIATDGRFPLPFGADRALLAWITTKAFPTGSVTFAAIADYLEAFGLDRGGRGYRLFRERFLRVANLALRLESTVHGRRSVSRLFLLPTSEEPLGLLADPDLDLRRELFCTRSYHFSVDPYFWAYLRDSRVPTPLRLLRRFHSSPKSWDFAQLVLYRSFAARSPSVIPWPELLQQMGARDRHHRRLKQHLQAALRAIRELYPDCPARFDPKTGGLRIQPWKAQHPDRRRPDSEVGSEDR